MAAKKIVAVVSDLMFGVKIQGAAKRAGLETVFVKTKERAIDEAKQDPALIIVDLNDGGVDALELIGELKASEETRRVRLLAFVSHVQADLIRAAKEKGCDQVLPRSAFSNNVQGILEKAVS
jgi:CheY-like chemotaxis protein